MRIIHLASSLGPNASAQYLSAVVPRLGVPQLVLNLGGSFPFEKQAREGAAVEAIRFRGPFDPAAARRLRRTVDDFAPTVVHAWGARAAAKSMLIRPFFGNRRFAFVAGDAHDCDGMACLPARWAVRSAVARRDSTPILDATEPPLSVPNLGLPEGARYILNAGGFDERSDQRAAVWSYDMLRYVDPHLHLVMVGDGPQRSQIESFAASIARGDPRIHFLGIRDDVPALLAGASTAFVTHRNGGRAFAAEALAAGTPVVTVENPDLAATIRDGENGLIAKRGNYSSQAAALNRIRTDGALVERLRAGARATRFPTAEDAAADLLAFYRKLAG